MLIGVGHAPINVNNQVQARLMAQRAAVVNVHIQMQQHGVSSMNTINVSYDTDTQTATATCEY